MKQLNYFISLMLVILFSGHSMAANQNRNRLASETTDNKNNYSNSIEKSNPIATIRVDSAYTLENGTKMRIYYTYGNQDLCTSIVTKVGYDTEWIFNQKEDFTYNDAGFKTSKTISRYEKSMEEWIYMTRDTIMYNEQNIDTLQITAQWTGGEWKDSWKSQTVYNEKDSPVSKTEMVCENSTWTNNKLTEYVYTEEGEVLSVMGSKWISGQNQWSIDVKQEYTYNEEGLLIMEIKTNYSGYVINFSRHEWTYNDQNQPIEKLTSEGDEYSEASPKTKIAYTYDNRIKTEEVTYKYSKGIWKENKKISYQYNDQWALETIITSDYYGGSWSESRRDNLTLYTPATQLSWILRVDNKLYPKIDPLDYLASQSDVAIYAPSQATISYDYGEGPYVAGQTSCFYTLIAGIITVTADPHGTVTPHGTVEVKRGESQTFSITPDADYLIQDVKVDGASVGKVETYTIPFLFFFTFCQTPELPLGNELVTL